MHLACARHEHFLPNGHRAGFFLGDGPGVGKGRQIAALVTENLLRKRGNCRVLLLLRLQIMTLTPVTIMRAALHGCHMWRMLDHVKYCKESMQLTEGFQGL